MSVSLYEATVPGFIQHLNTLDRLLTKGENHVGEDGHQKLLDARLIEDMKPLTYQIQRLSDTSKFLAVRAGGIESEPWVDDETTFPQLHARIQKTIKFLEKLDGKFPEDVATKEVDFSGRTMPGKDYILRFVIPNFFFHYVTAYGLLRKEGVPVGKLDYLGQTQ
ncbi:hypothetical protein GLAREA_09124 [Glarea lozoyensis ATCC 20868]|uniref:DUF1993 domain-containing protein n=1 Tax=Glarea lozoyensis (strain ATCC 20868 / MF5171) TaxID=1116229 RepID=S3DYE9_GLAL2|nr:uncharacterized protein GLAREA_09124 [Glarea lozoyensis ATCC 20868]EPE36961.1 hypothetical protein GLAREA_09124 [Glarea lozoyensis ATCC 20868]